MVELISSIDKRMTEIPFEAIFRKNNSIMLLWEYDTSRILDANDAALDFYGYGAEKFLSMSMNDIIVIGGKDPLKAINLAESEDCTTVIVRHKLSSGEIRVIESQRMPVSISGKKYVFSIVNDITDMAESVKICSESQITHKATIDSTTDLIWSVEPENFGLVNWNNSFKKEFMVHCSIDICMGLCPDDLYCGEPEVIEKWNGFYRKALEEGPFSTEYTVVSNQRVFLLNFDILKQIDYIFGISVFGKDITEKRIIEEALEESESRFRQTVDCIRDSVGCTDLNGKFTFINSAAERMFGWSLDEMMELSFCDILAEEYRQRNQEVFETLDFKNDTNLKHIFETRGICKNGSEYWAEITWNYLFSSGGKPVGYVGICRDITERKANEIMLQNRESHYRSIVENINEAIYVHDIEGVIIDVNSNACAMLGYDVNELPGMHISNVDRTDYVALLEKISDRNQPESFYFETIHTAKNGKTIPVQLSIKVVSREGRGLVYVLSKDISELKKHAEKLRVIERMNTLGVLAGGIAHDFNNILGAIVGYADMSFDEVEQKSRLEHNLKQILTSAMKAKNLVSQILSFSRQEPDMKSPIFLRPILKEVLQMLRSSLPATIEITGNLSADTRPVLANSSKIHELVLNLCVNSSDAMNERGILEVNLREELIKKELHGVVGYSTAGLYSVIEVIDTGVGIDPHIMPHIFEPYFTTKTVGKGTGLGLAVVLKTVQSCNGNIVVESEPGEGTNVKIYLPKSETVSIVDDVDDSELPVGTERILYIDDELILCNIAKEILGSLGYKVTTFSDSLKALQEFRMNPYHYDLVITDQTMPEITGIELTKEIFGIRERMPILLCTGYSKDVDKEIALQMGIKAFCMKPIRKSEIARKIRVLFNEGVKNG